MQLAGALPTEATDVAVTTATEEDFTIAAAEDVLVEEATPAAFAVDEVRTTFTELLDFTTACEEEATTTGVVLAFYVQKSALYTYTRGSREEETHNSSLKGGGNMKTVACARQLLRSISTSRCKSRKAGRSSNY